MSGSTVLIVDDEQTLARSAKAFLADHGYEAEVATSGEKAMELLESLQPDVVFADVRLPGMSGLDLLKRIHAFDPVIPVVMLTAYGSIEGAVEAVKLGAFDYVKKPVDLEELKLLADRARETRLTGAVGEQLQLLQVHRLLDVVEGAELDRFHGPLDRAVGRQHDDGDHRIERMDSLEQIESTHPR